jgi:DNA modification methylase
VARIVFEATEAQKESFAKALNSLGMSYSEWFQARITDFVSEAPYAHDGPRLSDAISPEELADFGAIVSQMRSEDWSFEDEDTGYFTHSIHPYPAKFIPQIPGSIIRRLSLPGEMVLDPFGGSGTTATEAVRHGRTSLSIDSNPLSELIGTVKVTKPQPTDLLDLGILVAAVETYVGRAHDTIASEALTDYIPQIPNIEKWFKQDVTIALALLRKLIAQILSGHAEKMALVALSRIIVRVSNQDSETRYVAKESKHDGSSVFRQFVESVKFVARTAARLSTIEELGESHFVTADSRYWDKALVEDETVGLIVTSPPYPNATDYHLYHRFRMFWLGYDPRSVGQIEIGSHLKHQRNGSGIEEYERDMLAVLRNCHAALMPGRYLSMVVGDSVFSGESYRTSELLVSHLESIGFEDIASIERPVHKTRRSFAAAGRRLRTETIVLARKPDRLRRGSLVPPAYRMWDYERTLRALETEKVLGLSSGSSADTEQDFNDYKLHSSSRLVFSRGVAFPDAAFHPTWQARLENGSAVSVKKRNSKYVTHGVHAYKGKFYPQLAKSLVNVAGVTPGATILDPFCGSGTVLLEGYLNGFSAYGIDLNPLAVKIARSKTAILEVDSSVVERSFASIKAILGRTMSSGEKDVSQFAEDVLDEVYSWFPTPVVYKLGHVLKHIRLLGDSRIVEFMEVVLSDCIRQVSQQDPTDLRIRRRRVPLDDAPLIELFLEKLDVQQTRLEDFWRIRHHRPAPFGHATAHYADNRLSQAYEGISLESGSVDAIITSPPYATALPYIDTDRLSIMSIMGLGSTERRQIEEQLTGSREISTTKRKDFEARLGDSLTRKTLPQSVVAALEHLYDFNSEAEVGFRRRNMPSLLLRYFLDMNAVLDHVRSLLKPGAQAFFVVGDTRTRLRDEWFSIQTTQWLLEIGQAHGLLSSKMLDISVTKENLKHSKNAIVENAVLVFTKQ